jgi:hypothetical protein
MYGVGVEERYFLPVVIRIVPILDLVYFSLCRDHL